MPQRREVVERDAIFDREPIPLADFAEELRLANAVDAEVSFEVGVELHDLGRVARLFDHELDEEGLELAA